MEQTQGDLRLPVPRPISNVGVERLARRAVFQAIAKRALGQSTPRTSARAQQKLRMLELHKKAAKITPQTVKHQRAAQTQGSVPRKSTAKRSLNKALNVTQRPHPGGPKLRPRPPK